MVGLSYAGYNRPPLPKNCHLDYQAPATDEDGAVVASVGARVASARAQRALYASASKYGEYVDQFSPSYPFGVKQSDPATELTGDKIHRVAITSGGRRSKKLRVANSL